jgi:hypothetical protein
MSEFGPPYTKEDIDLFLMVPKTCLGVYNYAGVPIAFGCVVHLIDGDHMTYSWHDSTIAGKRAYVNGIDEFLTLYPNLKFGSFAKSLHIIQRRIR